MSTDKFSPSTAQVLGSLSQGDFLSLGVDAIAYIKPDAERPDRMVGLYG